MTEANKKFAFPLPQVGVPVAGTDRLFPVRRIYCVGRNYAAHIREMGNDERALPFFFQKPADAIVLSGASIPYPVQTSDFQHEIEFVLAIGKGGAAIAPQDAADHVFGLAVGIDLTRRDLQFQARDVGRPWESGKAFDHSAPISPIHALKGSLPKSGRITLSVNGVIRQDGDLKDMIWPCDDIIAQLSGLFMLMPGDLIYTGTPVGVGPLQAGDVVQGGVADIGQFSMTVGNASHGSSTPFTGDSA